MVDVTDITHEIIAILEVGCPTKKWCLGRPPKARVPDFPFGVVEFAGGTSDPLLGKQSHIEDLWDIFYIARYITEDKAEEDAMAKMKVIEDLIINNPTINSKVESAWIERRIMDRTILPPPEDYSMICVKLTLHTRRKNIT